MVKHKLKLGMVGLSEGNGHPYSFSAIINGYDKEAMRQSGWEVIYNYLLKCDRQDFLNRDDVAITHLYTQDSAVSENLARACKIPHITHSLDELARSDIDALIIARDDWQRHREFAAPFLESGRAVFIDKPLSLDSDDIAYFLPFLESQKLMSCSGLRYARELDSIRKAVQHDKERIMFIEASIGSAWDRYLIHLLDGIMGLEYFEMNKVSTMRLGACVSVLLETQSFTIQLNNRNAHFPQPCTMTILTDKNRYEITLSDNFSAFRRAMGHFVDFACGAYSFDYRATLESMRVLGEISKILSAQSSRERSERAGQDILENLNGGGAELNLRLIPSHLASPHLTFARFDSASFIAHTSLSHAHPARLASARLILTHFAFSRLDLVRATFASAHPSLSHPARLISTRPTLSRLSHPIISAPKNHAPHNRANQNLTPFHSALAEVA